MTPVDELVALAEDLSLKDYRFVCPTPESHARQVAGRTGSTLQDLYGWSLSCERSPSIVQSHSLIETDGGRVRSPYRFSTFRSGAEACRQLYVHSAWPTTAADSVFFGPDTYAFLDLVEDVLRRYELRPSRAVDLCCGAGAGAIVIRQHVDRLQDLRSEVYGLDLNDKALELAQVNSAIAKVGEITYARSDLFAAADGQFDLIVSNPPYIASGDSERQYADGGSTHGLDLPLRIFRESLARLAPGGVFVLYTGVAVVSNDAGTGERDRLRDAVDQRPPGLALLEYRVINPDIFGEELSNPLYAGVLRIQTVGLVLRKEG